MLGHRSLSSSRSARTRSPGSRPAPSIRASPSRGPSFVTNDEALAHGADVTILCLSHEAAAAIEPPAAGVVVDLSGAHRLRDAAPTRPGTDSSTRDRTSSTTGLRADRALPGAGRLIANPGCYATATLLALAPLKDAIEPGSVVVDGMSGMTGAGGR